MGIYMVEKIQSAIRSSQCVIFTSIRRNIYTKLDPQILWFHQYPWEYLSCTYTMALQET